MKKVVKDNGITKEKADRRPTPYEIWKEKNKPEVTKKNGATKLNVQQWDKLVDKMYSMNRAKLSTQAKGQNQGLASELGGY